LSSNEKEQIKMSKLQKNFASSISTFGVSMVSFLTMPITAPAKLPIYANGGGTPFKK
jgi:hypothetical protein